MVPTRNRSTKSCVSSLTLEHLTVSVICMLGLAIPTGALSEPCVKRGLIVHDRRSWVKQDGSWVYVKLYAESMQGVRNFTNTDATAIAGKISCGIFAQEPCNDDGSGI